MELPISEVRKRLPSPVRKLREDDAATVRVSIHGEPMAEIREVTPEPEPGEAARRLLDILRRLPRPRGRRVSVSSRVAKHLYGRGRRPR